MSSGENQSRSPHRRWYVNSKLIRVGLILWDYDRLEPYHTNAINIVVFEERVFRDLYTSEFLSIINEKY